MILLVQRSIEDNVLSKFGSVDCKLCICVTDESANFAFVTDTCVHRSASTTSCVVIRAAASTRVLEYYSSIFLLLEYSLISISGCKFPFPVAVFLQTAVKLN